MANPDTSNVRPDTWQLIVDDNPFAIPIQIEFEGLYDEFEITSADTGTDVIDVLITGRRANARTNAGQWTHQQLKQWLGLAGTADTEAMLAVGDKLPTHTVRLHDPNAADDKGDLYWPRAIFREVKRTMDGKESAQHSFLIFGLRDDDGDVLVVGEPAA